MWSYRQYADVYLDLTYYIKTIEQPLIILDEAGDLQYDAFLEIKALWNATEKACGYYIMGADGLREKMRRSIDCKKVGYTEIFSRFGKRYQTAFIKVTQSGKLIPMSGEERNQTLQQSAAMIIKANQPEGDCNKVLRRTMGDDDTPSLRRIYIELSKNKQ